MGSSYLIGTACMGIRIAAAPAGPRNDNVVLMLQGRPDGDARIQECLHTGG